MITFSGELMWTAQLSGGGVLCLDMRHSHGCAQLSELHSVSSLTGEVPLMPRVLRSLRFGHGTCLMHEQGRRSFPAGGLHGWDCGSAGC